MATTGFWPVKSRLKEVLDYAENPDKTTDKKYLDVDLYNALRYVGDDDKTDKKMYVSAINCPTKRAYEHMMATKRRYGKLGGNVAYHGYQSFVSGEVTKRSIDDMRSMFGNEIFRGEQYRLFEMQTHQRELVKEKFKERIKHFEENGYTLTPQLEMLFVNLVKQLKSVKGKKVYGYLPKDIKDTVDIIVGELAKDEDIAGLYSRWNDINREKLSLYHEKKTPDIPLKDNKEFRSIKNVIVKAAAEFINTPQTQSYAERTQVAFALRNIICTLLSAISQSYNDKDKKLRSQADGKLRSKIAQKKAAHGIRPEQSDYENNYEQSM